MLLLVAALALSAAATTPPGTGYSDADSCPPPEKTPFGAVVTHSCSFCASTLTGAPLIRKDAAWQSVAFANHATDAARLVEVDAAGRELPRGTIALFTLDRVTFEVRARFSIKREFRTHIN